MHSGPHLRSITTQYDYLSVAIGRPPSESMKRRSDDIGIESCPPGVTDSPISMPCTKKLRRYVSEDSRSPSKVLWKSILEEHCDNIPPSSDDETLSSDEGSEQTSQEIAASSVAENDTWYSVSALAACFYSICYFDCRKLIPSGNL